MDHAGNGILIEKSQLNEVTEIQNGQYTFDKFRYMCILSGCDYLASLSGIGLARANKVFKIARQTDVQQVSYTQTKVHVYQLNLTKVHVYQLNLTKVHVYRLNLTKVHVYRLNLTKKHVTGTKQ